MHELTIYFSPRCICRYKEIASSLGLDTLLGFDTDFVLLNPSSYSTDGSSHIVPEWGTT